MTTGGTNTLFFFTWWYSLFCLVRIKKRIVFSFTMRFGFFGSGKISA